jgi:poly(hydroxyalkanoate) granule-associated protein
MVKKLQKLAEKKTSSASGLLDSQFAGTVKDSAQQIWLAGLGAFAKAQEEGGKVFEALVKEGVSIQRKTQAVAEDKLGEVTGRMASLAGDVQSKAGKQWDKLESIFEDRVAKAMSKLGVPSSKDVEALIKRIDELSAQVAKLSGGKAPAKTAARTGAAAKTNGASAKPAAKPAAKRGATRSKAA